MKIVFTKTPSKKQELIVITTANTAAKKEYANILGKEAYNDFQKLVNKNNFTAEANSKYSFQSNKNGKSIHILVLGTGKNNKQNDELFRNLGNAAAKEARKTKNTEITLYSENIDENKCCNFLEGLILGNYKFDKYITEKNEKQFEIKQLSFFQEKSSKTFKDSLKKIQKISNSTCMVRDLVNSPAIDVTPTFLGNAAKNIAKQSSKIKATVLGQKEIKKLKMGLIEGVSSGTNQEPKLIILEYKNKPKNKKPIMIVGKGVTFDAGGLNLKINSNIEGMKMDMAGGATVLGVFDILSKLEPNLHVVGIVPAVENLVGGKAYKPDDILTAYNGKTVEITNTDAEGRLILADSLAYGNKKYKPETIIDLATLTGACITALGYTRAGLFSNNTKLRNKITDASKLSGNKTWPLPLDDIHKEKVKGEISDYKNYTAGTGAGSSMAAAFLEKFVGDTPWAHIDIAGVAFIPNKMGYKPKGATGEPTKLIYTFLENY